MSGGLERRGRPWWVRGILWGLGPRSSAWACAWLCLAIALASVGYAVVVADRRFLIGGTMVLGAIGYLASIHWVDRHGSWSGPGS